MGRSPCCSKEGLNRGAWTALEDKILTAYIKAHGEGKWRSLPKRAGLKRCGKSCRLRWLNYLRPDIKRGNISGDEEELIIRLHNLLGNRWSLIAGRLPGRTDNEIKNYWNTTLAKKAKSPESTSGSSSKETSPTPSKHRAKKRDMDPKTMETTSKPSGSSSPSAAATQHQVIRTRAIKCTKVVVPPLPIPYNENYTNPLELQVHGGSEGFQGTDAEDCNNNIVLNFGCDEFQTGVEHGDCVKGKYCDNLCIADQSLPLDEAMLNDWTGSDACNLEDYGATLDLDSLAFLLDSEEWPSQENII